MQNPVIILTSPRSGSSLTAGIIANHGVWTGDVMKPSTPCPTGSFENIRLKALQIAHCGRLVHECKLAEKVENWREMVLKVLKEEGYESGPWMVKTSALYYPVWEEFNPKYVFIRREEESIRISGKMSGMNRNLDSIRLHNKVMDELDGFDIWPGKYINGDYTELKKMFDYLGLEFKPGIADELIDKKHWHYGG